MNLEDLVDEGGLQQDSWSLTKPTFGSEGQLHVIGWSGKQAANKFYILKCIKCSNDPELFAEGLFRSLKNGLVRGQVPCGCSRGARYSDDQWNTVISRMLTLRNSNYTLISHQAHKNKARYIRFLCRVCKEDNELFGDGSFKVSASELESGAVACGCSTRYNWSKEQYFILCSRKAVDNGYKFIQFEAPWLKTSTKVSMVCKLHGQWSSGSINNLLNKSYGCPTCGTHSTITSKIKSDEIMINSFLASGNFHPDTKFWRSERKTKQDTKVFWNISCPECGEVGESSSNNLQKGKRPCACSPQRQRECYINLVVDGGNIVAVKFGIARDSAVRVASQDRKSLFSIKSHLVYKFPDVTSCKTAERECKKLLVCGVIRKDEMRDGYTETTYVYNLDKIKQIYERHGGIEVCPSH